MAETVEQLEAALATAQSVSEEVEARNALIWALRAGDLCRAVTLSEGAVAMARAAGEAALLAPSLCMAGVCAGLGSQHQAAVELLRESLTLSCQCGDQVTEAICHHYIGRVYWCLAEYAAAVESIQAAIVLRTLQGDQEGMGNSHNLLGIISMNLCDYSSALDWHSQALEMREQCGDDYGVVESLNNIGAVYMEMDNDAQALLFHQRGLAHVQRLGNQNLELFILCNLGGDFLGLNRPEEALEFSGKAVCAAEALGEWDICATAMTNKGSALEQLGRYAQAVTMHRGSLEMACSTQNQDLAAEVLCHLGTTLVRCGELSEARTRLAEAVALAQSVGAQKTVFLALRGLSDVCRQVGDYAAALGHSDEARRIEKEIFSEEADKRAKSLVIQMEVEHHRREAEAMAGLNQALTEANAHLQEANARLEALATADPLTGLPNHRALIAALDAETARCQRGNEELAVLFLDIDHFKSFNDTYGHPVGDAVLREFASCVRSCLREMDVVGRWGGEEFLVLLPGTGLADALQVAERVCAAVAACPLAAGAGLHMTCSIGVSACPPEAAVRDILVETADQALYAAKRLGRNQVRCFGDPAIKALGASLSHGISDRRCGHIGNTAACRTKRKLIPRR